METTGSKRREKGEGSEGTEKKVGKGEEEVQDGERRGREKKDGVGTGGD